jgi:DNA-binding MarR family transcriptional regulator
MTGEPFSLVRRRISVNTGVWTFPQRPLGAVFIEILPQSLQDGSRITDLAEAAVLTKQTVGFLVDQLQRAGYVERTPDPRDGRARLVRVAQRGAAAVQASMSVVAEVEAQWTAYLGETRTAQLREALTILREITDPYQATDGRSKHNRG